MNLIPESNGLHKVKNTRTINGKSKIKIVIFIILFIILFGTISQQIMNFLGNEQIEISMNYAKVESKKLEYSLKGEGEYTVVFLGDIGTTLSAWNEEAKYVRDKLKLKTFVYNRNGYGFSDIGDKRTPKDQADDLSILLRKSGVSGNIIIVAEGYGGLIATNYISNYPDNVKGLVLINSLEEEKVKLADFKKQISKTCFSTKMQYYGCYFSVTSILDSFDKTYQVKGFEESLSQDEQKEFKIKKNKKDYRKAIYYEFENLEYYDEDTMKKGLLSDDVPLYIVAKDKDTELQKMGNLEYTTVYSVDNEELLSISDSDIIDNGISVVLKDIKKITKKEKTEK